MIGAVALEYLNKDLANRQSDEGTARFVLDRLMGEQVAVICQSILQSDLAEQVEIKVRESLGREFELPDNVLTQQGLVHWRHAECHKPALLIAGVDDSEEKSFGVLTPIGAKDLKAELDCWVNFAARDIIVPDTHLHWWKQALKGLLNAGEFSLEQFAQYVALTQESIATSGIPVRNALGWALPALELPRDSGFFQAIPDKKIGQVAAWEKRYKDCIRQRKNLLLKQRANGKEIEAEDLLKAFSNVREEIPAAVHSVIEQFINSSPGWHEQAEMLSQQEWEQDRINSLFSGMKTKSTDLSSATTEFFEEEFPNELTQDEIAYLENLKKRKKTTEIVEEDREFYEKHRKELESNRSLKAKWDKFVYGQPLECTDFLSGLLSAVERLFERAGNPVGKKQLVISTKRGKQSKWLELNADLGLYFCTRYRGLKELTAPQVKGETELLFNYDEVLAKAREKGKKISESAARNATEIKFFIELTYQAGTGEDVESVQLIWRGKPETIGAELRDDLQRLEKTPLLLTEVRRELVNKKGKLQGISLHDVTTLTAVFGKDSGSLVSTQKNGIDLSKTFPKALKEVVADQLLTEEQAKEIKLSWEKFEKAYEKAVSEFTQAGVKSEALLAQTDAYNQLLLSLLKNATGDKNRSTLLAPALHIGYVRVTGGKPVAIIAPWHPLRLAAIASQNATGSRLIKHISTEHADFGDQKLFLPIFAKNSSTRIIQKYAAHLEKSRGS
ncbi:MAG: hypothetical protein U0Y68_14865 [Blastocatellia bacterium]